MRSSILTTLALAALIAGGGGHADAAVRARPEPSAAVRADTVPGLIPVGSVRVTKMGMVAPPRLNALVTKMQAALRGRAEWWTQYMREKARPGEPLPYHANMGLSEAEYTEMLGLYDRLTLAPVGEATLVVRAEGERRLVLDGGADLPELTGVVIDLARNRVETPFGATTEIRPIEPSEHQSATGPWAGVSWKREEMDPATTTGVVVTLSMGRLRESGRGILDYDATRVANGAVQGKAQVTLTYDLPAR